MKSIIAEAVVVVVTQPLHLVTTTKMKRRCYMKSIEWYPRSFILMYAVMMVAK